MVAHNRIKTIAEFLGVDPVALTLGDIDAHHVAITTGTADGYIGLAPSLKISTAVVRDSAVHLLQSDVAPEDLKHARALVIRNDNIPHVNICLCNSKDISVLDDMAAQVLGEPSPLGREYPDCVIEKFNLQKVAK